MSTTTVPVSYTHLDVYKRQVHIYPLWWSRLYPVCYYFTGAYLSEYMPEIKTGKAALGLLAFLAAYSVYFYFHYDALGAALIGVYQDTWEVYILSVLLFTILYRLPLAGLPRPLTWCLKDVCKRQG